MNDSTGFIERKIMNNSSSTTAVQHTPVLHRARTANVGVEQEVLAEALLRCHTVYPHQLSHRRHVRQSHLGSVRHVPPKYVVDGILWRIASFLLCGRTLMSAWLISRCIASDHERTASGARSRCGWLASTGNAAKILYQWGCDQTKDTGFARLQSGGLR